MHIIHQQHVCSNYDYVNIHCSVPPGWFVHEILTCKIFYFKMLSQNIFQITIGRKLLELERSNICCMFILPRDSETELFITEEISAIRNSD